MKPNFLIIGAAKAGTTALYEYLIQHPDVFMSEPKEPQFFPLEYDKGMQFYLEHYYSGWSGQHAIGEARPTNLYLPYVPERIWNCLPDAKLIVILRNPTERAYSAWSMFYSYRSESLSFEDAITKNIERIEKDGLPDTESKWRAYIDSKDPKDRYRIYVDAGYYDEQIKRYLEFFPREQIKFILFEDFIKQTDTIVKMVWEYGGVDPNYELKHLEPSNISLSRSKRDGVNVRKALRLNKLLTKNMRSSVRKFMYRMRDKPKMSPEIRMKLTEHFRPHNEELERILGIDVSHWNKVKDGNNKK